MGLERLSGPDLERAGGRGVGTTMLVYTVALHARCCLSTCAANRATCCAFKIVCHLSKTKQKKTMVCHLSESKKYGLSSHGSFRLLLAFSQRKSMKTPFYLENLLG